MEQTVPQAFGERLSQAESKEVKRPEKKKKRPETDVMLEPEEAARRHEEARLWNLASGIDETLGQRAILRDIENTTSEGMEKGRRMEALRDCPIANRQEVGEPGVNTTETGTIETKMGESVRVFIKPQNGELRIALRPDQFSGKNRAYRALQVIGANGVMRTEYRPFTGRKANELLDYLERRAADDQLTVMELATHYGIAYEESPLNQAEIGLRVIDAGHGARAEYAASAIDRLTGFDVIPNTALREDKGTLATVQENAAGAPLTYDQTVEFVKQGPRHPGAKSLMRLACMDYLLNSTDRHMNNFLYDPATHTFKGIDNGYSNGYSHMVDVPGPDGRNQLINVPLDPYLSGPMEITEQHDDWFLDDEAVNNLKNLFDEIKNYLLFAENKLEPTAANKLPRHVREGMAFKALNDIFSLLHERTGPDGQIKPSSTKIASREVTEFLRRLNHLIVHRRPPKLPQQYHSRVGIAKALGLEP